MSKDVVSNEVYSSVACGEINLTDAAVVLPSIPCKLAYISALKGNTGYVYIGGAGVTVATGSLNVTTGLQLEAGDTIGPLPIPNLNVLYGIAATSGDDISYLVLR